MKIGLALSGGGIKGAAHIGVLQALEEENIKFEFISGTSSGSIVATLYACGYKPSEIYDLFKKYCDQITYIDFVNILKLFKNIIIKGKISIDGLNSGKKIEKLVEKACKEKNIKNINQINFNLMIPAVDLNNGEIYYFKTNNKEYIKRENRLTNNVKNIYNAEISKVVRASCSYPGIFSPCDFKNIKLIDGGIRENTPWKELKNEGADNVICVCFETIDKINKVEKEKNIFEVIMSSIDIMQYELFNYELFGADYIIKIRTEKISLLDKSQINYLYNLGYQTTKNKIKEIKLKLNKNNLK